MVELGDGVFLEPSIVLIALLARLKNGLPSPEPNRVCNEEERTGMRLALSASRFRMMRVLLQSLMEDGNLRAENDGHPDPGGGWGLSVILWGTLDEHLGRGLQFEGPYGPIS